MITPSENRINSAAAIAETHVMLGTRKIAGSMVKRLIDAGVRMSPDDLTWDARLTGPAKTFALRVSRHSERIATMVFTREETASACQPPFSGPVEQKLEQLVGEILRIVKQRPAPK